MGVGGGGGRCDGGGGGGVGETETLEAKTNFDPPEKGDKAVTHENTHPTCHSLDGFYGMFPTPCLQVPGLAARGITGTDS